MLDRGAVEDGGSCAGVAVDEVGYDGDLSPVVQSGPDPVVALDMFHRVGPPPAGGERAGSIGEQDVAEPAGDLLAFLDLYGELPRMYLLLSDDDWFAVGDRVVERGE